MDDQGVLRRQRRRKCRRPNHEVCVEARPSFLLGLALKRGRGMARPGETRTKHELSTESKIQPSTEGMG